MTLSSRAAPEKTEHLGIETGAPTIWDRWHRDVAPLADRQLFFIGGMPRSGTTWLQQMLDVHSSISCRGEGHFMNGVAAPLQTIMVEWRKTLEAKNRHIFSHTSGYGLPAPDDADFLTGTAILLALHRQNAEKKAPVIGEKTPENAFAFSFLKSIFPGSKFIGVVRDPRDVLTSAWHFFHKPIPGENEVSAKLAFVRKALPSLIRGVRDMLSFARDHPDDIVLTTYEALLRSQPLILAQLFRYLGVSDSDDIVADCIARTEFSVLTGGRPAGIERNGAFLRKGVIGDWRSTLSPEVNDLILRETGWMFERFSWTP